MEIAATIKSLNQLKKEVDQANKRTQKSGGVEDTDTPNKAFDDACEDFKGRLDEYCKKAERLGSVTKEFLENEKTHWVELSAHYAKVSGGVKAKTPVAATGKTEEPEEEGEEDGEEE